MKSKISLVMAALALAATAAMAQPQTKVDVMKAPRQATVTGITKVTATVVGIDAATRTVSLKDRKGRVEQLVVGEEVRNFDQIKLGDVVSAEYREAISLSLKKGHGLRSSAEREVIERSAPGAKPGGTIGREMTVMANVIAVNTEKRMVTLKGPMGNTVDLLVEDPAQLQNIRKGDQVEAVYTEAVAIAVEPATGK
ncbi:hypothetical protein [Cupriavidus sp. CuC1]|uniref:hypothetical protein n=1 Tax=Cupriavidus sp. CuC1 TaxID=3373131 RepID=UPI0037D059A6